MSGEIFHAPLLSVDPGFALTTIVQRKADKAKNRYPDVKMGSNFSITNKIYKTFYRNNLIINLIKLYIYN